MKTIIKTISNFKVIIVLIFLVLIWQYRISAQEIKSPKIILEGRDMKVTYGQPSKRGRVIFGDLVPYGEVWRTGANEATEITFLKDVIIDKKEIKAGVYTLFTIPQQDKWAIILNSKLGQWGTHKYRKTKEYDILKVDATVRKSVIQEKLIFSFKDDTGGTILFIAWDDVVVEIPITYK